MCRWLLVLLLLRCADTDVVDDGSKRQTCRAREWEHDEARMGTLLERWPLGTGAATEMGLWQPERPK